MPGTILLHRDPETKGSLYFQVACEEEKHLIIIQLLNPLRFPPPSSPSSHLAFCFFLFLPKKELRHAEGREPGLVRGKPAGGGGTEMTVRGVVSSQVSGGEALWGRGAWRLPESGTGDWNSGNQVKTRFARSSLERGMESDSEVKLKC